MHCDHPNGHATRSESDPVRLAFNPTNGDEALFVIGKARVLENPGCLEIELMGQFEPEPAFTPVPLGFGLVEFDPHDGV